MDNLIEQLQKADRLTAITQRVGFALWQLQELEGVAATYFVLLTQAEKGMGVKAGHQLEANAKKKTFGTTIRSMAEAGLLQPELEKRFREVLAERNWLVHRSKADSRGAIHSEESMQRLLARLDAIASDALSLLRCLGELTLSYAKEHRVSEAYITDQAKALLEEWHREE